MARTAAKEIYKISVDERSVFQISKDKKLTGLILAEFLKDDATKILNVTPKCYFGFAFLVGECETLDDAARVVEIAREITKKPVIPFLMKKENEEKCNLAENLRITTEINVRLLAEKKIFATNLFVKTVQCKPVLMGIVGSKEAETIAINHARSVTGVEEVISLIGYTGTNRSWDQVFKSLSTEQEKKPDLITE
jgi:hyperosmotically inducible protein